MGETLAGQGLIDYQALRGSGTIFIGEDAASFDGDAHGREVAGHDAEDFSYRFFAVGGLGTVVPPESGARNDAA